ncbi:MAG: cyclodeaminase/cyclohydrolase family protein [Haloquadratum sp.]
MSSPTTRSLRTLLDDVAADRVAPAGGTGAAVTGAMGAALCEMVCLHTDAGNLRSDLERRRQSLLALADRDAAVVDELFGGGQAAEGPSADARLQKRATGVPLAVAEASLAVLAGADRLLEGGRSGVLADAETGAYLADAALRASLATVRINLDALADPAFAATVADRADSIEGSAAETRASVFHNE